MSEDDPIEFVMIIDPLPSSKLDIVKYLKRQDFIIKPDLNKENRHKLKCKHGITCEVFNEMIMLKEFMRDDALYFDIELMRTPRTPVFVENGHITNLLNCRLSNVKLFKKYMKEFKLRRRKWKYRAIVVRNHKMPQNALEKKMNKDLLRVLELSQIDYIIINKFKNLTFLRKNIFRQLKKIKNPEMDIQDLSEFEGD